MFKPDNYYCVIHKDFSEIRPIKCIIFVRCKTSQSNSAWCIEIKRIFKSDASNTFYEGMVTSWFENWCEVLKEFNRMPTESEMLVYAL